jgi:AcrR family transcriptional regulator
MRAGKALSHMGNSAKDNDTRNKIVAAMYHLIGLYGYDKASLSKICEEVGITKPSVYYYFPSKEDILVAVLDEIHITTESDPRFDNIYTVDDFRNALLELGNSAIARFKNDTERARVLAEIELQESRIPAIRSHQKDLAKKTGISYRHAFDRGIEIGALPPNFDSKLASEFTYTLFSGFSQAIVGNSDTDVHKVWEWTVDSFLLK